MEETPAPARSPMPRLPRPSRDAWSPVAGHLLLPLQAAWRRDRTRRCVPSVERMLALPADRQRVVTLARLRRLILHARATVPFWRDRMDAAGLDPRRLRDAERLRALPPLTRAEVAREGARLVSRIYRGRTLVSTYTGGTTSEPVPFVQSPAAVWWKAATATVLRRRIGWWPGDRVALLWGASEDFPPPPRSRLARWRRDAIERVVERIVWFSAEELSEALIDRYLGVLRRFRPQVLQAYPSAADLVARRLLSRGARLRIPIVLLTAETVFAAQRRRLAEAFGAEVFSFYGAREIGWIAEECPAARRLHLNTAGVHLEAGEDDRLLVTDLVDPATPLIRYEIGDRGRLARNPCPCGDPRPVLAELHGRVVDVFRLPSGRQVPGVVCDIRNYQLADGVVETQLVQHAVDRLEVRWVAAPNFVPEHLEKLRSFLDERFQGELRLEMKRVDRIEPERNGKIRYCISHVPASVGEAPCASS